MFCLVAFRIAEIQLRRFVDYTLQILFINIYHFASKTNRAKERQALVVSTSNHAGWLTCFHICLNQSFVHQPDNVGLQITFSISKFLIATPWHAICAKVEHFTCPLDSGQSLK